MKKFTVAVTYVFEGVEADSQEDAFNKVEVSSAVLNHPDTNEYVFATVEEPVEEKKNGSNN